MAITFIRRCTKTDKVSVATALKAAGIKVRIRLFDTTMRVCIDSAVTAEARETVVTVLNGLGYRYAGGSAFHVRMFNQPHELFVAGVAL